MSAGIKCLELKPEDAKKIIASKMHLGSINANYQMSQYIFKRCDTGAHVFCMQKQWEKLMLAARAIAAIENPKDVCVVSTKQNGQRAILKFASFVGSLSITGRFSPGSFTNHAQSGYHEPRLIIVTDPTIDHQAVREASYVNIPVIGLCNVDTCTKYIDVCIPCNNNANHSIGLVWWFLAREVLRLRGTISRDEDWTIMPDLFFFRDQDEIKKQEEAELAKAREEEAGNVDQFVGEDHYVNAETTDWQNDTEAKNEDWNTPTVTAPETNWDTTNDFATAGGDWAATDTSNWQ